MKFEVKPLHGKQDEPVETIIAAREAIEYLKAEFGEDTAASADGEDESADAQSREERSDADGGDNDEQSDGQSEAANDSPDAEGTPIDDDGAVDGEESHDEDTPNEGGASDDPLGGNLASAEEEDESMPSTHGTRKRKRRIVSDDASEDGEQSDGQSKAANAYLDEKATSSSDDGSSDDDGSVDEEESNSEDSPNEGADDASVVEGAAEEDCEVVDQTNGECVRCKNGGILVGCDECHNWYHPHCADLPFLPEPNEDWLCPDCDTQSPAAAEAFGPDTPKFECVVCCEERLPHFEVKMVGCTCKDNHFCSKCVYQEMERNSECPCCRNDIAQLRHKQSGKVHVIERQRRDKVQMTIEDLEEEDGSYEEIQGEYANGDSFIDSSDEYTDHVQDRVSAAVDASSSDRDCLESQVLRWVRLGST